jgi:hypothetical protein
MIFKEIAIMENVEAICHYFPRFELGNDQTTGAQQAGS